MSLLTEPPIVNQIEPTLSVEDVKFIASATRSSRIDILKTHKNIAASESGFSNALKNDWMKFELDRIRAHEQIWFLRTKDSRRIGREAQREALKGLGSSKGAKVRHSKLAQWLLIDRQRELPTMQGGVRELSQSAIRAMANGSLYDVQEEWAQSGWVLNPEAAKNGQRRLDYIPANRSRAYLMRREWSNQTKIQVVYHPTPSDAPTANAGERYTEKLSSSAVRKIFESGAYVAATQGGFTTFLTLTFTPEKRNEIFLGNITLGSEVSRFIDGLKKMYKRGFRYVTGSDETTTGQRNITLCSEEIEVKGNDGDFHYIWVAECPMNEDGEPNPHVHMLLNWQVDNCHFKPWAARIESLWGHGIGHLERIKYGAAASGYLIKAVGYAAKGSNADQGLIKGNRYNIARCSRAPAWEVLMSFDVDNMTGIIKECAYKLKQWRAPIVRDIERKKKKHEQAVKAAAIAKMKRETSRQMRVMNFAKRLETEITELKTRLKSRGVFARTDSAFSICFDGEQSIDKADDFLLWAAGARGWSMHCHDVDMTPIKQDAVLFYQPKYEQFRLKQAYWRAVLQDDYPPEPSEEEKNDLISWYREREAEYYEIQRAA